MNRNLIILLLSACLLMTFSCKKKGQTTQAEELIQLENTGCRGKCPAFQFSLKSDGSATYWGRKGVENKGHFKGTVSKPGPIFEAFKAVNWSELETEYLTGLADIPRIRMTYNQQSVVCHQRKMPEELDKLQQLLKAEIATIEWKKTEAPQGE